jgi:hypothetical protein
MGSGKVFGAALDPAGSGSGGRSAVSFEILLGRAKIVLFPEVHF